MTSPSISRAGTRAAQDSADNGTWKRFLRAVRVVAASEIGGRFRLLFSVLLALLLVINGLNVANSFVGRDLMTSIEQRSSSQFLSNALLYVVVFAALTVVAVFHRFIEERLGLLWREWLTRRFVDRYLEGGVYLRLKERGELGNPDQRIAEDARLFTASTLSFVLMILNAVFAIFAFSGVMWSISPLLFLVAVGYAALGSLFTVLFGRPLVRLNYDQSDREASFRAELVHVGENAESVALLQRERRLNARLRRRLDALVSNMKRIVAVNRNLSFFTTGYNYGIQLVPALIIGPLFMRGKVEFGVITQSAIAFAHLLGGFSLIVTQFQTLSSYAAVVARLTNFAAAVERVNVPARSSTESTERPERLTYEDVTLRARSGAAVLVAHLTITVPTGTRLLVTGTDQARLALFRATALLWDAMEGRIVRPASDRVLFLPERPYVPLGTLRELIVRTGREREVHDEEIRTLLRDLDLEPTLERMGGLDVDGDWDDVLSLGEQQLLAVARIVLAAPAFALLHSPGTTLAPEQLARALRVLSDASITYVVFGGAEGPLDAFDAVLELRASGAWRWQPLARSHPGVPSPVEHP
jgi:vitamin B12/bleomycin/antimicrobial peptide transport system ATP-binding/permease protein